MYKLYSDLIGTLPHSQEFLVPLGFTILIVLLLYSLLRLVGFKL